MRRAKYFGICLCLALGITACGKKETQTVDYVEIAPQETTEPVVVIPKDYEEEKQSTTVEQQEEVTAFADQNQVEYQIEDSIYEEGYAKISYPVITGMENVQLQQTINENIEKTIINVPQIEGLSTYSINYEIATKGTGIFSVIFRGEYHSTSQAYPVSFAKTLNIDMTTGKNLRLKDYADMATVVSCLEQDYNYEVISEQITKEDFSHFINNGYLTDYAILLLDFDIDFDNLQMQPSGYSCIKDNHLEIFMETEHVMGDYAEIRFEDKLTD